MLLRGSSAAVGDQADLGDAVAGDGSSVQAGRELIAFTEAAHRLDEGLRPSRDALTAVVGAPGMVQAAMTAAVFRGLNLTADASGIPIDDNWSGFVQSSAPALGTDRFASAANSAVLG